MSTEKPTGQVDVLSTPDLSTGEIESQGFDPVATKKLLRKLDWHIIPFMSLIYLLSVLPSADDSIEVTDAGQMLSR